MDDLKLNDVMLYLILDYAIKNANAQQTKELDFIMKQTSNDNLLDKMVVLFDLDFVQEQLSLIPDFAKILDNILKSNDGTLDKVIDKKTDVNEHIVRKIPLSAFTWKH